MRLKDYLNKKQKMEELNNKIHENCKFYLQLIKPLGDPLYRGMDTKSVKLGKKKVRKNRIPSGTDKFVFKNLNEWLEKKGHNRRDVSFMTSSNKLHVQKFFSTPYFIFPIGKFSYTWIKSKDLNLEDSKTGWDNNFLKFYDYENNEWIQGQNEVDFESYFTTDKGFNIAYKNGYEIWINCDYYYYIKCSRNDFWNKKTQKIDTYHQITGVS